MPKSKKLKIAAISLFVLLMIVALIVFFCLTRKPAEEPVIEETTTTTAETTTTELTTTTTVTATYVSYMREDHATEQYLTMSKASELAARTEGMSDYYDEFVGWLYVADCQIDYPIMRAKDNDYYLYRTVNGVYDKLGSLFMDYRNAGDFSDHGTIVYGHNMNSGKMFGDIRFMRNNAGFNAHKYGWLFTEDTVYRIDFFALSVLSGYDILYNLAYFVPLENPEFLERIVTNAHFRNKDVEDTEDDYLIALSTCAGDFEEARALLTGKLVPMKSETDFIR